MYERSFEGRVRSRHRRALLSPRDTPPLASLRGSRTSSEEEETRAPSPGLQSLAPAVAVTLRGRYLRSSGDELGSGHSSRDSGGLRPTTSPAERSSLLGESGDLPYSRRMRQLLFRRRVLFPQQAPDSPQWGSPVGTADAPSEVDPPPGRDAPPLVDYPIPCERPPVLTMPALGATHCEWTAGPHASPQRPCLADSTEPEAAPSPSRGAARGDRGAASAGAGREGSGQRNVGRSGEGTGRRNVERSGEGSADAVKRRWQDRELAARLLQGQFIRLSLPLFPPLLPLPLPLPSPSTTPSRAPSPPTTPSPSPSSPATPSPLLLIPSSSIRPLRSQSTVSPFPQTRNTSRESM